MNGPVSMMRSSWWEIGRRIVRETQRDRVLDWAAALTYYAALSIFPGLLMLVSILGLIRQGLVISMVDSLGSAAPEAVRQVLLTGLAEARLSGGGATMVIVIGFVAAFYSTSRYVAAFVRAANDVYDIGEGRPIWRVLGLRFGMTILMILLLALSVVAVVFTGRVLSAFGASAIWTFVKWPVLALIAFTLLTVAYGVAPNVRHAGVRWLLPGAAFAVAVWVLVSFGSAVYVTNFASYNRVYGALAGVAIFLLWLWLSNIALLMGLEVCAELERERAIARGGTGKAPYVNPRVKPVPMTWRDRWRATKRAVRSRLP